jgi:Gluconate 2-dehydrogenase subunit 3
MDISRRDAIKRAALMLGGTFMLPDLVKAWDGTPANNPNFKFTLGQEDTLEEFCEMIIPTTSTPGAKAAGVPAFIRKMVADCHTMKDQKVFAEGLDLLDTQARRFYGTPFATTDPEKRTILLKETEATGSDFWKMAKNLVVTGYFTSEIGLTQNTRYEMAPGRYDGSAPYKKGDKIITGG